MFVFSTVSLHSSLSFQVEFASSLCFLFLQFFFFFWFNHVPGAILFLYDHPWMFNCLLNGCLTIIIMKSLLHECRLTCVYAACKIEENHVSAEELGKGISQDHQMILNYEMIVYQALFWAHISLSCPFFFSVAGSKHILSCRLWNLILSSIHHIVRLKDLLMIWK